MHHLSLAELRAGLRNKRFSAREIAQHYCQRIKQHDPELNSCIAVTEEIALQQADQADQMLISGKAQPLTGIPILHKDIFCTKQAPTTCGSKMLANFTSPYESTVTERCEAAGMLLLGKTNMDEFAMGSSNETSFFGPCHNPWDHQRVPGGSSGGAAAAVAARLTPIATGTDTGGSIRQPAGFCGVTGLKPTYGRVSRWGMIAFASSLDQAGILARSAADCAELLSIMAGHDVKDATCSEQPVDAYIASLADTLSGRTLGLPKQFFNQDLSADMANLLDQSITVFKSLGVRVKEVDLPHLDASVPAYYVLAPAECSSNLSRYDGIRFGYRAESATTLEALYKTTREQGFGDEVKRRILMGTYTLCTGYYDAYYRQAQKIRHLIQQDFLHAFADVDALLGPCTPQVAFKLGEKATDPVSMYQSDRYTIAVNLAGLPALSIPAGFIEHLPVGLQLIGPGFAEARLLNLAHQYQCATQWHLHTPKAYQ